MTLLLYIILILGCANLGQNHTVGWLCVTIFVVGNQIKNRYLFGVINSLHTQLREAQAAMVSGQMEAYLADLERLAAKRK